MLRHRAFVAVIGLNALFIFAGFSGFELLPVYAKNEAAVSEMQIGLVFLVNTIVVVLLQLPIARLAQGRRRMPALGLLGLLWAAAWLIVPIAGSKTAAAATLLFIGAMVIFAVGECLHGAVHAPLVTDLAEPRLLGRYMALSALSWQAGFALGPAVGGLRPRLLAERRLDRGRGRVRARRHARVPGRDDAPGAGAANAGSGACVRLASPQCAGPRKAPGLQSRTWL